MQRSNQSKQSNQPEYAYKSIKHASGVNVYIKPKIRTLDRFSFVKQRETDYGPSLNCTPQEVNEDQLNKMLDYINDSANLRQITEDIIKTEYKSKKQNADLNESSKQAYQKATGLTFEDDQPTGSDPVTIEIGNRSKNEKGEMFFFKKKPQQKDTLMEFNVFVPIKSSKNQFLQSEKEAQKFLIKGEQFVEILDIEQYNSFQETQKSEEMQGTWISVKCEYDCLATEQGCKYYAFFAQKFSMTLNPKTNTFKLSYEIDFINTNKDIIRLHLDMNQARFQKLGIVKSKNPVQAVQQNVQEEEQEQKEEQKSPLVQKQPTKTIKKTSSQAKPKLPSTKAKQQQQEPKDTQDDQEQELNRSFE